MKGEGIGGQKPCFTPPGRVKPEGPRIAWEGGVIWYRKLATRGGNRDERKINSGDPGMHFRTREGNADRRRGIVAWRHDYWS